MSKYTSEDPDVKSMEQGDRIQYEFDLLEHDVENMIEASYATMAIKNPKMIKEHMTSPKIIYSGILMFLVYVFTIIFIILFIIWLILFIKGSDSSTNLRKVMVSILFMLVLLLIITFTIKSMQGNMIELVEMTKEPVKDDM